MISGRHRVPLVAVAVAAAIAAFAVAGCAPADARRPVSAPKVATAPVVRMEPGQVRAEIATSFPIEVAVAQGTVVRGQSQGPSAWDYEIVVQAPPANVAEWYRMQYERRSWKLDEAQDSTGEMTRLTLRKGTAESEVTIEPTQNGSGTRVRVILSTGVPVLQTQ